MRRLALIFLGTFLLTIGGVHAAMAQSPSPRPLNVPPSDSPATDLVAQFPTTLDGRELGVEGFSGPEWIARYDRETPVGSAAFERAEALLASADRTVDDLSIATVLHVPSPGNVATIAALQLRGADAYDFVESAIGFMLGEIGDPVLELTTISDRTVLRVRDASLPGMYPVTIYTVGDTVWFVDAERPLLEEVISALPDPPRAEAAYDLAAISPVELGGRRRAALYVQSGWETPFRTLRFHIDNDQLVEDAFLATGARLDDLTAAYVEWLPGESERVAFLIAFQIAGADATVMRQVFEEVLLPHMGRGPFRQEAGQIASRDVILLWDDEASEGETTPPLYLYVSGDTIWFVDAEQPMSAAIVAALPPSAPRAIPGYDLAADLPDEFGGVTRTELLVESGWTVPLASMTLMELDQVATEVIALTGAGADDLATASGMSMEAGFDTTIAAYQVRGADPEAMREVLEEVLIPRLGGGQTRHELVDVDGREVFRLHTGLGSGEPSYLFVNGDTIWWLHAGESFLTDLFAELP